MQHLATPCATGEIAQGAATAWLELAASTSEVKTTTRSGRWDHL